MHLSKLLSKSVWRHKFSSSWTVSQNSEESLFDGINFSCWCRLCISQISGENLYDGTDVDYWLRVCFSPNHLLVISWNIPSWCWTLHIFPEPFVAISKKFPWTISISLKPILFYHKFSIPRCYCPKLFNQCGIMFQNHSRLMLLFTNNFRTKVVTSLKTIYLFLYCTNHFSLFQVNAVSYYWNESLVLMFPILFADYWLIEQQYPSCTRACLSENTSSKINLDCYTSVPSCLRYVETLHFTQRMCVCQSHRTYLISYGLMRLHLSKLMFWDRFFWLI